MKKSDLPIFQERMELLRRYLHCDGPVDMGEKLGVSRQSIGHYLNGDRIPDAAILYRICKAADISSDYLLGLTDVASNDADIQNAALCTGLSEIAIKKLSRRLDTGKILSAIIEDAQYDNLMFAADTAIEANSKNDINVDIHDDKFMEAERVCRERGYMVVPYSDVAPFEIQNATSALAKILDRLRKNSKGDIYGNFISGTQTK